MTSDGGVCTNPRNIGEVIAEGNLISFKEDKSSAIGWMQASGFSTGLTQHQDMVTRPGWADEGVVFCGVL